jgi:hypothetical protein
MKKYILPWEEHKGYFGRRIVKSNFFTHVVWKNDNGSYTVYNSAMETKIFQIKELAMNYADKCCLDDGFIEMPEKLRILI